eukprot:m.853078 g.853078  ORF g.853078 m.853078 type:complete len:706 (-) comp59606_c0_seq4:2437-4554(-)
MGGRSNLVPLGRVGRVVWGAHGECGPGPCIRLSQDICASFTPGSPAHKGTGLPASVTLCDLCKAILAHLTKVWAGQNIVRVGSWFVQLDQLQNQVRIRPQCFSVSFTVVEEDLLCMRLAFAPHSLRLLSAFDLNSDRETEVILAPHGLVAKLAPQQSTASQSPDGETLQDPAQGKAERETHVLAHWFSQYPLPFLQAWPVQRVSLAENDPHEDKTESSGAARLPDVVRISHQSTVLEYPALLVFVEDRSPHFSAIGPLPDSIASSQENVSRRHLTATLARASLQHPSVMCDSGLDQDALAAFQQHRLTQQQQQQQAHTPGQFGQTPSTGDGSGHSPFPSHLMGGRSVTPGGLGHSPQNQPMNSSSSPAFLFDVPSLPSGVAEADRLSYSHIEPDFGGVNHTRSPTYPEHADFSSAINSSTRLSVSRRASAQTSADLGRGLDMNGFGLSRESSATTDVPPPLSARPLEDYTAIMEPTAILPFTENFFNATAPAQVWFEETPSWTVDPDQPLTEFQRLRQQLLGLVPRPLVISQSYQPVKLAVDMDFLTSGPKYVPAAPVQREPAVDIPDQDAAGLLETSLAEDPEHLVEQEDPEGLEDLPSLNTPFANEDERQTPLPDDPGQAWVLEEPAERDCECRALEECIRLDALKKTSLGLPWQRSIPRLIKHLTHLSFTSNSAYQSRLLHCSLHGSLLRASDVSYSEQNLA